MSAFTDSELPAGLTLPRGFTLVELMVSMVIALVIMAGLYGNFAMQSKVQATQASSVASIEDLRVASQIMATQLKLAAKTCWDGANKRLVYQPLGAVNMTGCSSTFDNSWGTFEFAAGTAATGGTLCWHKPNDAPTACDEVLRGLNSSTGFQVTTSNANLTAMRSVTLISQYKDMDRQQKDMRITFEVLPRNN